MTETDIHATANARLLERRREFTARHSTEELPPLDTSSLLANIKTVSDAEAESLRRKQPEHNALRIQLLAEATLPKLHEANAQETTDKAHPWSKCYSLVQSRIGTGFVIALLGTRGAGKTQLATSILLDGINRGMRSRFVTVTRLLMEIKASYAKDPKESELQVIDRFTRYKLLVIDEVSRRSEKDWNDLLLFELLNARYNSQHGTILISNETREAFGQAIGASMLDRMKETGGIIECNWPSFRQRTKQ